MTHSASPFPSAQTAPAWQGVRISPSEQWLQWRTATFPSQCPSAVWHPASPSASQIATFLLVFAAESTAGPPDSNSIVPSRAIGFNPSGRRGKCDTIRATGR
jgi:hypothetical protein